jgi:hypothetical protein
MNRNDDKISLKEMNDNLTDPEKKEPAIFFYDDDSKVRSISFVFENEDRKNFYYHNLIDHEYLARDDSVVLNFSSGKYIAKGKNMLLFYKHIRNYRLSEIFLCNERYSGTVDDDEIAIFSFTEVKKTSPAG